MYCLPLLALRPLQCGTCGNECPTNYSCYGQLAASGLNGCSCGEKYNDCRLPAASAYLTGDCLDDGTCQCNPTGTVEAPIAMTQCGISGFTNGGCVDVQSDADNC